MILLDTDTLTHLLLENENVKKQVAQVNDSDEIALTVITRIEVLQGRFDFLMKATDAKQLRLAMQRLQQTDADLEAFIILPIDDDAAAVFDKLRKNKKLKKIGRADLLIASIALAQQATLITRNIRHFQKVPGLKIENWID